jgi:hypothetical protein
MFLNAGLVAVIIIGLVVIVVIAALPYITPMFDPVSEHLPQEGEQKSMVRALLVLGVLGFIAIAAGVLYIVFSPSNPVTPAPVDTLPTTYPSATP